MSRSRWARRIVALASILVPARGREEWREEWEAEVAALERHRAGGREAPAPVRFALGAVPHALWTRTEGWTMEGVKQDIRYAVRVLRRSPGFTAVAALTLALGIGANAAIFSLVNGLLFRPPGGIEAPERLVQIARSYEEDPRWDNWSWPALQLIADEGRVFEGVAGFQDFALLLGSGVEAEQVAGQLVTGNFFALLGVRPFLGRLIGPDDDRIPGAHPVAVLSHDLWVGRFGADASVVGRTVSIGSEPYEVIGVAPPGFEGVQALGSPPRLWLPAMQYPARRGALPFGEWGWSWIRAVGRLQPGVEMAEARQVMAIISNRLRAADPGNEGMEVLLAEGIGLDPRARSEARRISALLLGVVGLVLLLACSNVANLFLARASTRRGEIGVRAALGAGRARMTRQLMTESLVLALLATALAVPVARAAGSVVPALFPVPLAVSVGADARVYLFLLATGLLAGLLFGAVPAWSVAREGVAAALRQAGTGRGRAGSRLRDGLVVLQLGISLGLVAGAALLARSLVNAREADPGVRTEALHLGFVDLEATGRYDETSGRDLVARLLQDLRRQPGVEAVTVASQAPIAGGHSRAGVLPVDRPEIRPVEAEYTLVGPDYFESLGIPLREGRLLGGFGDEPEPVVVINESLARMYWPGESAVGKRLERADGVWTVVGVVGDVQMRSLRAAANPGVYYPLDQAWRGRLALHIRMRGGVPGVESLLRERVADLDPGLPVLGVRNLREAMAASLGETRTIGYAAAAFGFLALILAAVGLYGIVAFGVAQRTREMGVRKALGAPPGTLVGMVLRRGMGLGVAGVAIGGVLAVGVGRALGGLLFGVSPLDPAVLAFAGAVLLAAAVLAAWVPARRAARVDPVTSLRVGP